MPSSVLSSDSMHIGLLDAAATNSCFTVFYNPRASPSEFVIPLSKYVKVVFHTRASVGMRFRMLFETEESSVRRFDDKEAAECVASLDISVGLLFGLPLGVKCSLWRLPAMPGKGELNLDGQLDAVVKESTQIALRATDLQLAAG